MTDKVAVPFDIFYIIKLCIPTVGSAGSFISLFFAAIFLSKDKMRFWRVNFCYIILVILTEIVARYCGKIYRTNLCVFNVYSIFEISFITYGFYVFIKPYAKIKNWMLAVYAIIMIIYTTYTLLYGINVYNAFTISIASVVFVVYGLLYFYLLLKDEDYIDLKFHPAFWWVGGTLIFYFGSTLANFFDDIIQQKFLGIYNTRFIIYATLNFFLYGFWAYSFVCRARQRKLCL